VWHRNKPYCRWCVNAKPVERRVRTEHAGNRILSRVEDLVEEGLDQMAAIRAALGEPEPRDGDPTIGLLVKRYLAALERGCKRKPHNMVRERSRANAVLDAPLADLYPADLTRADVARWCEWLQRERKQGPSTVNRSLAFASATWQWAQEFALAPEDRNPFRMVRRTPERPRDKGETLTSNEVEALAQLAPPDFARLIRAAFQTAARPNELQALEWRDVRLDGEPKDRNVRIRPEQEKAGRGRRIPITPKMAQLLREIRGDRNIRPLPTARIFLRSSNGQPWTDTARSHRWRKLMERVTDNHLPDSKRLGLQFYDLRAAAITRLLGQGIAPAIVQKIAGHTHLTTTMRYVGNLNAEQQAAAPAMAAALSAR
jgi:integrase